MPESQGKYQPSRAELDEAVMSRTEEQQVADNEREKQLESQEIVVSARLGFDEVVAPINGKLYSRYRNHDGHGEVANSTRNENNEGPLELSKELAAADLDKAEKRCARGIEYYTKQLENIKKAREILSKMD